MNMNKASSTTLIDLMSDKHLFLRKKVAELDGEELNRTETHILAVVETAVKVSISEIGRAVNLTRQGTHKSVLGLIERGYLEESQDTANRRDRYVRLTSKGQQACDRQLAVKRELELEIAQKLGQEHVEWLKRLLVEEWI
ncbi:MarR family winged helix-turn-helix transcriptional regulator [Saccharibacillus sacchari]|uniref:MarR family winged helix-turn-helix transcriptional regulator n=1 Tax=Saccharibacillus sacchari TaxID=456493 RepID=UPI0004B48785|nr:winged helix DNA-binding protein [Saccharibacillus sacchari]